MESGGGPGGAGLGASVLLTAGLVRQCPGSTHRPGS